MKYSEIPKFQTVYYRVDVDLDTLPFAIDRYRKTYDLDIDPDFQRHYVWTEDQQTSYMEYIIRNGLSSRTLYFNCPYWGSGRYAKMVLVDGQQRLKTIFNFLDNRVPVFGGAYLRDFEDASSMLRRIYVVFSINNLVDMREVVQWYLDLNTGGTIHTEKDLTKARNVLNQLNQKYGGVDV